MSQSPGVQAESPRQPFRGCCCLVSVSLGAVLLLGLGVAAYVLREPLQQTWVVLTGSNDDEKDAAAVQEDLEALLEDLEVPPEVRNALDPILREVVQAIRQEQVLLHYQWYPNGLGEIRMMMALEALRTYRPCQAVAGSEATLRRALWALRGDQIWSLQLWEAFARHGLVTDRFSHRLHHPLSEVDWPLFLTGLATMLDQREVQVPEQERDTAAIEWIRATAAEAVDSGSFVESGPELENDLGQSESGAWPDGID